MIPDLHVLIFILIKSGVKVQYSHKDHSIFKSRDAFAPSYILVISSRPILNMMPIIRGQLFLRMSTEQIAHKSNHWKPYSHSQDAERAHKLIEALIAISNEPLMMISYSVKCWCSVL